MRGQKSLFDNFITPVIDIQKETGIGRSKLLISQRDRRLIHRYYYYTQLRRRNFPDTISILSVQFDLSEFRIVTCITTNRDILKDLSSRKPNLKELERLYPWMNWNE